MTRYANVTAETAVIAHTGRGTKLPVGRYEVAELDGNRIEDGKLFLDGPNGDLVQANPHDTNITIEEN